MNGETIYKFRHKICLKPKWFVRFDVFPNIRVHVTLCVRIKQLQNTSFEFKSNLNPPVNFQGCSMVTESFLGLLILQRTLAKTLSEYISCLLYIFLRILKIITQRKQGGHWRLRQCDLAKHKKYLLDQRCNKVSN